MGSLLKKQLIVILAIFFKTYCYAQAGGDIGDYKKLLEEYKLGNKHLGSLKELALMATRYNDTLNANIVANEYIRSLKEPIDSSNYGFINEYTKKSNDPGFKILLRDSASIDKVLGENTVITKVTFIIFNEEIAQYVSGKNENPDWKNIERRVVKQFGMAGEEILLKSKVIYFMNKKEWENYGESLALYIQKFKRRIMGFEINNYAWKVFLYVNNKKVLNEALSWSKLLIDGSRIPPYLDTYANLLYKLGKRKEAIEIEEEVMNITPADNRIEFEATLSKMRKGEPTWI